MNGIGVCRGGDHRAPQSGGSCPCGMVTRIPARRPAPEPVAAQALGTDVLALLERCLRDAPGALDPAASELLRERAVQLLAALGPAALGGGVADAAA